MSVIGIYATSRLTCLFSFALLSMTKLLLGVKRGWLSEKVEGYYLSSSQNTFAFWPRFALYFLALSSREAH